MNSKPVRWGSHRATSLAVRSYNLVASCITAWPTALPEAWPLFICLITVPIGDHIVLHIDCEAVIKLYDNLVQGTPISDTHWLKITDKWLWTTFIIPYAHEWLDAGGGGEHHV